MKLKDIGHLVFRIGLQDKWLYFSNEQRQLHRSDGPAYMTSWGYKEWWVLGEFIRSNWSNWDET